MTICLPGKQDAGICWYNDYIFLICSPLHLIFFVVVVVFVVISLPHAVITEPGLQLQWLETGIIPKQEIVTLLLTCISDKILSGAGCAFILYDKIGATNKCSYIAWW